MAIQVGLEFAWIAKECVVLIQQVGLAAEPADAFESGDEAVFPFRLRAIQLIGRRAVFRKAGNLVEDDLLDLFEIGAGASRLPASTPTSGCDVGQVVR